MSELTKPNATSEYEGYFLECEAFRLGAHAFVTLHRSSSDNSINGLRRRRRREQVIKKTRRAFCILGAAGLSLSNVQPSVTAQPFVGFDQLRVALVDIKSDNISKGTAPTYEMMINNCRSRLNGSIPAINDAVDNRQINRDFQHVVTDLFYLDDHRASAVTMFQVKGRDGHILVKEVRAILDLPSCTVSKISFGQE